MTRAHVRDELSSSASIRRVVGSPTVSVAAIQPAASSPEWQDTLAAAVRAVQAQERREFLRLRALLAVGALVPALVLIVTA